MENENNEKEVNPGGEMAVGEGVNSLGLNAEILDQILAAKKGEPNKFQSYWEMDEEDVDEFTQEEIENDPSKRILWAAETGRLDVVKSLVAEKPDLVHSTDADQYTPLHRAAYSGHTEITKFLLSNGGDINARTVDGWQPLHSACRWNSVDIADLLLQNGADANAQTNGGLTPLHLAVSEDNRETIELLLLSPFINPSIRNKLGETPRELCQRVSPLYWMFESCQPHCSSLK